MKLNNYYECVNSHLSKPNDICKKTHKQTKYTSILDCAVECKKSSRSIIKKSQEYSYFTNTKNRKTILIPLNEYISESNKRLYEAKQIVYKYKENSFLYLNYSDIELVSLVFLVMITSEAYAVTMAFNLRIITSKEKRTLFDSTHFYFAAEKTYSEKIVSQLISKNGIQLISNDLLFVLITDLYQMDNFTRIIKNRTTGFMALVCLSEKGMYLGHIYCFYHDLLTLRFQGIRSSVLSILNNQKSIANTLLFGLLQLANKTETSYMGINVNPTYKMEKIARKLGFTHKYNTGIKFSPYWFHSEDPSIWLITTNNLNKTLTHPPIDFINLTQLLEIPSIESNHILLPHLDKSIVYKLQKAAWWIHQKSFFTKNKSIDFKLLKELITEISTKFDNYKEHRSWISKKNFKSIVQEQGTIITQYIVDTYRPTTIIVYLKSVL
jgi:hypothetical protein